MVHLDTTFLFLSLSRQRACEVRGMDSCVLSVTCWDPAILLCMCTSEHCKEHWMYKVRIFHLRFFRLFKKKRVHSLNCIFFVRLICCLYALPTDVKFYYFTPSITCLHSWYCFRTTAVSRGKWPASSGAIRPRSLWIKLWPEGFLPESRGLQLWAGSKLFLLLLWCYSIVSRARAIPMQRSILLINGCIEILVY